MVFVVAGIVDPGRLVSPRPTGITDPGRLVSPRPAGIVDPGRLVSPRPAGITDPGYRARGDRAARLLKPRILIRGVVDHQFRDDTQPPLVRGGEKCLEIIERSV